MTTSSRGTVGICTSKSPPPLSLARARSLSVPCPYTPHCAKCAHVLPPLQQLLVKTQDRRIVVSESMIIPSRFRQVLADVLFRHFSVSAIGSWRM